MYNKNNKIKIGIIGYRSWISRSLIEVLNHNFDFEIVCIDKNDFIKEYKNRTNKYSCLDLDYLFVVPGKLKQSYNEEYNEKLLAVIVGKWSSHDVPILFLSSKFENKNNEYATHKKNVEDCFMSWAGGKVVIFKPPALFGELQPKNSSMLIPSIINTKGKLILNNSDTETEFLHIDDFIRSVMSEIFFYFAINKITDKSGTFFNVPQVKFVKEFENVIKITPRNLVNLYKVFNT